MLEAYEGYWDRRYPKAQKLIFDNTLWGNRKEAMRLCREEEGPVDIVGQIRALDTLKVAESPFAKVVKSRDVALLSGMFNRRKKDSKWRDIRLKKAVNLAINRKELWKYGAKGNAYSLAIFGAGPLGCELAQAFQRLGCKVTIVERGAQLLAREDRDAADILAEAFR